MFVKAKINGYFVTWVYGLVRLSAQHSSYIVEFENFIIRSAFQAIIASDGEVFGYEALSRIQCRDTGQSVRPDIFFKKNDSNHVLLFDINMCHLMTFKSSKFYSSHVKIFINLTPDFFTKISEQPESLNKIERLVETLGFNNSDIVAEVTEGESLNEFNLGKGVDDLSLLGFNVAMDDFGDGGSDINRFEILKTNIVKISRNIYLENIENNPSYLIGLINHFHNNKAKVVVEGIEGERHVEILKNMGVDYFQGFFFHKPELVEVEVAKGVS